MKPRGRITIDEGAARRWGRGRVAAPRGRARVEGAFGAATGEVLGLDGAALGQGLTRYDAHEAGLIRGLRTRRDRGGARLPGRAALIHRDDMAF
jgi:glutamate 5-kinase